MMAERLGFEPRKELPLCRFSRPVLSTAQPSLREQGFITVSYTHLRAHETEADLVCRLLLEKKKLFTDLIIEAPKRWIIF